MIVQKRKKLGGRLVSKSHVDELVRNYKKQRWAHNSQRLGKEDSLSASYDLDALSAFLATAREQNANGIKVCFGVYPEGYEPHPAYAGRQTAVLVAVKQKTDDDGNLLLKDVYYLQNGKPELLAFNHADVCPPFCGSGLPGGGDWGDSLGITIFRQNDEIRVG
jgi:hypothetical protein